MGCVSILPKELLIILQLLVLLSLSKSNVKSSSTFSRNEDSIDNGAGQSTEQFHRYHRELPRKLKSYHGDYKQRSKLIGQEDILDERGLNQDSTVSSDGNGFEAELPTKRSEPAKVNTRYEPTWQSLDTRPLPQWYEDAKFGIFVHWGVFSVPAYSSEWLWWHWKGADIYPDIVKYMEENFPGKSYQDLASELTTKNFNATDFAKVVEDSGAKYFVFTSKHHEGFTNWPSNDSWNWNAVDLGPKRDIVRELQTAFTQRDKVKFGLYFSLYEWFNPWYLQDKENKFKTNRFVREKVTPQLRELVNKYKPYYIWSDGDWETTSDYWNSTSFLAWLYNDSPLKDEVLVNDRWGQDAMCKHGDVKTCADRYQPGKKVPYKWENAMTIDKESWGYRHNTNISSYYTTAELIKTLIQTVSYGGNLLMNIGPTKGMLIMPIFQDRLRGMGEWLKVNGEAIYGTRQWRRQQEVDEKGEKREIWYTNKVKDVYVLIVDWPEDDYLILREPRYENEAAVKVTLLGSNQEITWAKLDEGGLGMKINIGKIHLGKMVRQEAWVFKLVGVE
eukprot:TCONS_00025167-protein